MQQALFKVFVVIYVLVMIYVLYVDLSCDFVHHVYVYHCGMK